MYIVHTQICERCCCFGFVYNIKFEKENERNARCIYEKARSIVYLCIERKDDDEEEEYMFFLAHQSVEINSFIV